MSSKKIKKLILKSFLKYLLGKKPDEQTPFIKNAIEKLRKFENL